MSKREKLLSWLVGGVIFIIINFYAVKFLFGNHTTLKTARTNIETDIQMLHQQASKLGWAGVGRSS